MALDRLFSYQGNWYEKDYFTGTSNNMGFNLKEFYVIIEKTNDTVVRIDVFYNNYCMRCLRKPQTNNDKNWFEKDLKKYKARYGSKNNILFFRPYFMNSNSNMDMYNWYFSCRTKTEKIKHLIKQYIPLTFPLLKMIASYLDIEIKKNRKQKSYLEILLKTPNINKLNN